MLNTIITKLKDLISKLIALLPLPVGIAIGYLGHGVIKLIIDTVLSIIHLLLKI